MFEEIFDAVGDAIEDTIDTIIHPIKKIDETIESIQRPFYFPDHLPQNEKPDGYE